VLKARNEKLQNEDFLNTIEQCLLDFDKAAMQTAVTRALNAGVTPSQIVGSIRSGFETVSKRYEAGEFFLSELIMSGETAKAAINVLAPRFQNLAGPDSVKIVLGTVEGDRHDIGKNLVGMMLEAGGFKVVNLGVDILAEDFVDAAVDNKAHIIGLSALLTTTMPAMKEVIEILKEEGKRDKVKVIVGGAPVSQKFSDDIGADGYAPDAASAVDLCRKLLS